MDKRPPWATPVALCSFLQNRHRWSRCCFWNHYTSPLLTSLRQTPIRVFKTIPSQRRCVDSTKSSTLFRLTPGVQPASCWFRCQVVTPDTADHPLLIQLLPSLGFRMPNPLGFPPTSLAAPLEPLCCFLLFSPPSSLQGSVP